MELSLQALLCVPAISEQPGSLGEYRKAGIKGHLHKEGERGEGMDVWKLVQQDYYRGTWYE